MMLSMFLFSLIGAFTVANLEIQIEGKNGWASELPTWKAKNWLTRIFLGNNYLTGYHLWLVIVLLTFLQFPFFVGVPWSFSLELKIIGFFWFAVLAEDFFWFLLNPKYGIKKFNKTYVHWYDAWFLGFPEIYVKYLAIFLLFVMTGYLLQ